jgi:formylglycine-generating enzyme required for sulfatase activity
MGIGRYSFALGVYVIVAAWIGAAASPARAAVVFDWATVGNPGNAADPTTGYGSVAYTYQISKNEVTNSQYAEFLNTKAASDPLALYNTSMSSDAGGGINRSGSSGSYTYAVKAGQGNQPVVFVSWYDSIRFANWMNNGQGGGDTESGAYTIAGGTPTPSNGNSITRNGGATVFLTSENEWYKAAYHQPSGAGGDSDNYWFYPTGTNTESNSDQPPGDLSIQSNVANFYRDDGLTNGYNDGFAVTGSTSYSSSQNYLTDSGAYSASDSYYGTFDQGGNAFEWTETLMSGSSRVVRGGSWSNDSNGLRADVGSALSDPFLENPNNGFRLASVPEPSLSLLALGGLTLLRRRSRGRRMTPTGGGIIMTRFAAIH